MRQSEFYGKRRPRISWRFFADSGKVSIQLRLFGVICLRKELLIWERQSEISLG